MKMVARLKILFMALFKLKSVFTLESFQENKAEVEKLMQDCSDQDLIIEEFIAKYQIVIN